MKDNNNLVDYQLWSGGEYATPLTNSSGGVIKINNELSSIGENSILFTQNKNTNWGYYFSYPLTGSNVQANTTYTISFDVYCPDAMFYTKLSSGSVNTVVIINVSECLQHIELSITNNDQYDVLLQFYNNTGNSRIYMDNVNLIIP